MHPKYQSKSMPDLGDKLKGLSIVASYQSPVQHLPKHLSPQVTHSPTDDYKEAFATAASPSTTYPTIEGEKVPTRVDPTTNTKTAITPFTQILLLWISILIFIITIAGAVVGYIFENILFTSPIMIISSIFGLILSYSFKMKLNKIIKLKNKCLELIFKSNSGKISPQIESPRPDKLEEVDQEQNVSLLAAFRRGDFHKQLAICSSEDLKQLLPVVLSAIFL